MTALAAVAGAVFAGIYTWITRRLVRVAIQQREIIAAQQKLQSAQVKYMLYERRLRVFGEVLNFIEIVNTTLDTEMEQRSIFMKETAESTYIFGKDIQNYIHKISSKAGELHASITKHKVRFGGLPNSNKDRIACEEEMGKLRIWFEGQDYEAKTKFAPYLKIED